MIPDLYDRKLGLLEILAASWKIYKRNFKFLLLFVFLSNFLAYRLNYSLVVSSGLKISLPYWMPACWDIHVFFVSFVIALSSVFAIQITEDATRNESVTIRSVRRVSKRFLPTLVICFIFMTWKLITFLPVLIVHWVDLSRAGRIILTSAMTLIAIATWVYTLFVYPAMVLKAKLPVSAFCRSFALVHGRWWKMLWAWIVITSPAGAVCFLIQKMVVHFGLVEVGQYSINQHALWSLYSLILSFSMIGITILFLNIDQHDTTPDSMNPVTSAEKI